MTFSDPPAPPEPGESSGLRAKDLKNRIVVLKMTGEGTDPSKPDKNGRPWVWVACDVWIIDRSGVEQYVKDVRISWWRVMEQLRNAGDVFVAGRVTEHEDRSITVEALPAGDKRDVVVTSMPEIMAAFDAPREPPPVANVPQDESGYPPEEEPF